LKILSLAIFFSCFIRKSDNDKEAAEYLEDNFDLDLNGDEEYLQSNKVCFIIYLKLFQFYELIFCRIILHSHIDLKHV